MKRINMDSPKIFSIDIDGTLCNNTFGKYDKAFPIKDRIDMVNELYDNGNIINLFTARGTTTGIDWREITSKQLKKWGLKYHSLELGKPEADLYIDDKATNAEDFFDSISNKYINEHIDAVKKTFNRSFTNKLDKLTSLITSCFNNGGKLILAGNGGSFSDCMHLSAEFTGKFISNRKPLPSIVLGANNSSITSISNDYDFSECYSRELEALGNKEDIFIAFSTSGSSSNILKSLKVAKKLGIFSVLISSEKLNKLNDAELIIKAKSTNTSIIQEIHIITVHYICKLVESKMGF